MTLIIAAALVVVVLFFTLRIRPQDVPEPVPVSPLQHLEDRKTAIYENLRDLQFEFRVGKLSDDDYRSTKLNLQGELAVVLSDMDKVAQQLGLELSRKPAPRPSASARLAVSEKSAPHVCPHCRAEFQQALKFCGECGKAMQA